ncbi:unnamed protein product [Nippostrongylus brasiliensis]|uniref:MFS domain-containing protein n=1 Tax=Nippostrongylus brasiliensis TaxID=27835 RepID=A0A0N4XIH0_NIPBR|nr:unnamed protein product [Nippostrongylus brasiliensis]
MTMSALSSMVYMVYAGVRPTVVSCGPVHFNNSHEACERLSELMATTSCTPELEYQFKSVNVEILLVALIGVGVFSAANAFAMTFVQFTILRGITGFFTGCLTSVQGVFLVENIPKRHRMWINTIVTWSPNFIVYPAVAYVCRDWRALALFSTFAAFVSVVNLLFLHESPRWLIHHGRIEEARRIMSDIRRKNGKTCEKEATEIEQMLLREQEVQFTLFNLFSIDFNRYIDIQQTILKLDHISP